MKKIKTFLLMTLVIFSLTLNGCDKIADIITSLGGSVNLNSSENSAINSTGGESTITSTGINSTGVDSTGANSTGVDSTVASSTTVVQPTLLSISIKAGTLPKLVYDDQEIIDFSGIIIIALYDDTSTIEVTHGNYAITSPNLTLLDQSQTITITYQEKNTSFDIRINSITDQIEYSFVEWYEPGFITDFKANSDSRTTVFNIANLPYNIGDDNPFTLQPEVGFLKLVNGIPESDDIIISANYVPNYKIELKVDSSYQVLTGLDLQQYVDINDNDLDFTEAAIGKTFRITQTPLEEDDPTHDKQPLVLEAVIVNGYNVTTVAQLSIIDNKQEVWNSIKEANNLLGVDAKAVILHRDLDIVKDDLPADFFYISNHDQKLYMHRWQTIFSREVLDDGIDEFRFFGNYFTLKFDKVPLAELLLLNGQVGSFAEAPNHRVFEFIPGGANAGKVSGKVYFNNLSAFGNGNRANNSELYKSGSMIFIWEQTREMILENMIMCSFLSMANILGPSDESMTNADSVTIIRNSRSYDSYCQMFFLWDGNLIVEDSFLYDAGGPIFIATDYGNNAFTEEQNSRFFPSLTTRNTSITSMLSGAEPWFVTNRASDIVTQLKGLDDLFRSGTGKTLLTSGSETANEFFNLIALGSSVNPFTDTYKIKYSISIEEGSFLGLDDLRIAGLYSTYPHLFGQPGTVGAPFFFSPNDQTAVAAAFPLSDSSAISFNVLMGSASQIIAGNNVNVLFKAGTYLGAVVQLYSID